VVLTLGSTSIDSGNALTVPLREVGDRQRVDVIITNPPFGGEEERGILSNFPEDKQTAETALLFLQLIMRKLRRSSSGAKGGRCGMVVPNGLLFGDGVCARIKEELLREFNLHTIVRLPNGVFSPYTDIPTNILFFDRSGPTSAVWFYEIPLPAGKKQFTKTAPLQFAAFQDCLEWWKDKKITERAWTVTAEEILTNGCNLDCRNPNAPAGEELLRPPQLLQRLSLIEGRVQRLLSEINDTVARGI
jgi:type I restriction enzyme M protein